MLLGERMGAMVHRQECEEMRKTSRGPWMTSIPNYSGSASMTGLDWQTSSTFPVGFLEKNRDVLSSDILTLAYSSKNKFLKEIFNVESTETKLGSRTIFKAHRGNQLFKVGSCCPS